MTASWDLPFFQVDAFADRPFAGNPAAVCPLEAWLPDATLQAIAAENNLSETAYFVPTSEPGRYHLRWFTPTVEVKLCGHATLASAHVVFNRVAPALEEVTFDTLSGPLRVKRGSPPNAPSLLTMSFPAWQVSAVPLPPAVADAFRARPVATFKGRDLLVLFEDAETVRGLAPDMTALAGLDPHGVCVTAPGTGADSDVDFVSRFFAPRMGVDEDPVTGSTHTYLTPFWSERLGKRSLRARQVSARAGELSLGLTPDGVAIAGPAVLVIEGRLFARAAGAAPGR